MGESRLNTLFRRANLAEATALRHHALNSKYKSLFCRSCEETLFPDGNVW